MRVILKCLWDGIKPLSGLSNPPPLTSLAVNGTNPNDLDLAVAINESLCSAADDIPQLNFTPIPVFNVPDEYIITRDAVEVALVAVQNRKSVGPDEIPNWQLALEILRHYYYHPCVFHV